MTGFGDLGLGPGIVDAVQSAGYDQPTPIQLQAIPPALDGRDILGIAQTGTGKTASFALPMITHLAKGRARARMPRSLILSPTRELAAQIAENFATYSANTKLTMALLIGGVSFKDQLALVDRGADVLIATPGRLLDHHERGRLLLSGVQIMVVDEADRMLDMGFIPDIERIFRLTPFTRQTLFFSATMASEIERLTNEFLSNPVRVEVTRRASIGDNIDQQVAFLPKPDDFASRGRLLRRLIGDRDREITNAIIFCNRKSDVDGLHRFLAAGRLDCGAIHGDLDQRLRMKILQGFRDGAVRFLVASDVAARGLDIPNVSHIFNFDVPGNSEDYVHRIGRTGRAGRPGIAITLCASSEKRQLAAIEKLVDHQLTPLKTGNREPARPTPADPGEADGAPSARRRRRRGGRSRKPRSLANGQDRNENAPASDHASTSDISIANKTSPTHETSPTGETRTAREVSTSGDLSVARDQSRQDDPVAASEDPAGRDEGLANRSAPGDLADGTQTGDQGQKTHKPRRRSRRRRKPSGPSVSASESQQRTDLPAMGGHVPAFIRESFGKSGDRAT